MEQSHGIGLGVWVWGRFFFNQARKKDLNPEQLRCLATHTDCLFVKDLEPGEPFAATASTFCGFHRHTFHI